MKRIQGHIDIPLAETGLEQAQRLAERLMRDAREGARLDAIYSSDLQRAQQTALTAASALGIVPRLDEGLRERAYGIFQGHDSEEIAQRYPDDYARWQTRDPGFVPAGGESVRAFYHRIVHAVAAIVANHPGGRIATPEEIAMAAVFMISDECPFMNATCLTVDGGLSVMQHQ